MKRPALRLDIPPINPAHGFTAKRFCPEPRDGEVKAGVSGPLEGCLSPDLHPSPLARFSDRATPKTRLIVHGSKDGRAQMAPGTPPIPLGPYQVHFPPATGGGQAPPLTIDAVAVHNTTKDVRFCKIMTAAQKTRLESVRERLSASDLSRVDPHFTPELEQQVAGRILPEETEILPLPPTLVFIPGQPAAVRPGPQMYLSLRPRHFGDLHAHVRHFRRLPPPEVLRLLRQILEIVTLAHSAGLVLRNLKLRNLVFLDEQKSKIGLGDLDEVHICPSPGADLLTQRYGCPAYVPPELVTSGQPSFSGRKADMWGLGILLYVMLYGRYPFYEATPARLFEKIRAGVFCVPNVNANDGPVELLSEFRVLIGCLLRPEPDERPDAREILGIWLFAKPDGVFEETSRKHVSDDDDQVVPQM